MNSVFKVVWNSATQTWTAVSELSRKKSKSTSNNKISLNNSPTSKFIKISTITTLLGLLTLPISNVYAASYAGGNGQGGNRSIAILEGSFAAGQDSVAIGYRARVENAGGIAIGSESTANGEIEAAAIGRKATATGMGSLALGRETRANGRNATAVGAGASAETNNTAIGVVSQAMALASNTVAKYSGIANNET